MLCFTAFQIDPEIFDNLYIGLALVVVVVLTGLFTYYQVGNFIKIMAAIVVRIRTIGPIRTICPKWSDLWSEFDYWSEFSIDDTHA